MDYYIVKHGDGSNRAAMVYHWGQRVTWVPLEHALRFETRACAARFCAAHKLPREGAGIVKNSA